MTPIPLVLLTGFLGAGKTTALNDLLRRPEFADTAVIINEAGDVGIDHALIETGRDDVLLLEGGCICCRLRGSLNATLNALVRRRALDGLRFRRVVVETSGLADPTPILHALIADPVFTRHFVFNGVTAVVDATTFTATVTRFGQGTTQVALADRVLISKTDLAAAAVLAQVETEVAALNPTAERVHLSAARPRGDQVWVDPLDGPRGLRTRAFVASAAGHEVTTAALAFPGRIAREEVDHWLDRLETLFGPALLRLKGILWLEEMEQPVALHGVQGLVYSPGLLPPSAEPPENRMVLIADGIAPADLNDALTLLAGLAR